MKSYKGITLVALIITIAVLIIITAVSISAFNDNGIIAKAKEASNDYKQSETQEKDILKNILDQISEENNEKEEETVIEEKLLPDEYQEVEYLESTGTQYIDTLFKNSEFTQMKCTFQLTKSENNTSIFGRHYSNRFQIYQSTNGNDFSLGMGTGNLKVPRNLNIHTVYLDAIDISITFDDTKYCGIPMTQPVYDEKTIFIFGSNEERQTRSSVKIFDVVIYENYIEYINFIPCYRISDNKPGMYDLVEGKFYTNQGTGEFIVGPDVN